MEPNTTTPIAPAMPTVTPVFVPPAAPVTPSVPLSAFPPEPAAPAPAPTPMRTPPPAPTPSIPVMKVMPPIPTTPPTPPTPPQQPPQPPKKPNHMMWLIACAFLAIVFGAAGYYVTHQPSQTVVAPTVATTTTSTYVNTAYGYQFDYPSDHTPYSDLDKVNQSLIPAVSTSTMVNIAEIEAQNFCCEPAVIEFSSPFTNPESFPNHARKNVQLNGMPAIEIDGSSTIDSFYRVYFVEGPKDSTGNSYAVTITENTQNAFLDKVLSTFKFTLATSTTSSAPATTTPVAPFGTPPKP